jgi:glutamate racemase
VGRDRHAGAVPGGPAHRPARRSDRDRRAPGAGAPAVSTHPADRPIGIFDSGVGGLTVARAVIDQLPDEPVLYVGDTANGPYGPLPVAEVRAHALAVADDLVERGVKALVIACNTASAACLREARERYPVPVVEVIRPAVRRAVATTRNRRVGVIATRGTVSSRAYDDAFATSAVQLTTAACPRFVDFVERGITSGRQVLGLAQAYLEPLQEADVDTLVLGCTHYPLLSGVVQLVMGDGVTLVSSAEETAKDVLKVLTAADLLREHGGAAPQRTFLATGDPEQFARLGRRFLGPEMTVVGSTAAGSTPAGSGTT